MKLCYGNVITIPVQGGTRFWCEWAVYELLSHLDIHVKEISPLGHELGGTEEMGVPGLWEQ